MNLLGILVGFAGYVLMYAATANHGRFATNPMLGLIGDAYTGEHLILPTTGTPPSNLHPAAGSAPGTTLHPSVLA